MSASLCCSCRSELGTNRTERDQAGGRAALPRLGRHGQAWTAASWRRADEVWAGLADGSGSGGRRDVGGVPAVAWRAVGGGGARVARRAGGCEVAASARGRARSQRPRRGAAARQGRGLDRDVGGARCSAWVRAAAGLEAWQARWLGWFGRCWCVDAERVVDHVDLALVRGVVGVDLGGLRVGVAEEVLDRSEWRSG